MTDAGERVQKVLARAGAAPSRRKAEALITAGRVTVDGRTAALGERVGPDAEVRLDGRPVRAAEDAVVFALHKPRGVLSAASDARGRRTVLDLVPRVPGLHPVGRLDLDSEGLLLLTNDGDLTLRLTHPRYRHRKRYRVWCEGGTLAAEAVARLRGGVTLDDGAARADRAEAAPGGAVLELHEGRKRLVRRLCAEVGYPVSRLLRTHVAGVALGDLAPGAYRQLGPEERGRLGYTRPRIGRRDS